MSNLSIRRVVLYKHGVGYFEREAAVEGDQALTLSFKQKEVSDVLKSLTVLDLNGGTVSAVSYDSTTPVEQLLADIAIQLPGNGGLIGLLPQVKGARVAVRPTGSSDSVPGVLLGIDTVDTLAPGGVMEARRLSLLTDAGDVRTFDLFDVELQLLDDALRRDLDFYLRTQLAGKKKDARAFTLFAQGDGGRTLRLSYVLEAPVWKATYRVLLGEPGDVSPPEDAPQNSGGLPPPASPLIQGWAVVDNTSDEDWEDVALTLVAGLPVSFTHDLYTPRTIRRPVVEVKETTGVLPPMAEAGVESVDSMLMELAAPPPPQLAMSASPARMRRASAPGGRGGYDSAESRSALSSVQTQTRERQVGDLFEYAIEKPVTVRRNQSALVPILLKPFAGRSVLLYQKAARAENPIRCVEFENTTGLTLEGGPVTVLDQGSYAGEAMLDTLKPGEKRLVGYAVELAVRVIDAAKVKTQRATRVSVRKGQLVTHSADVQTTTYTFTSTADKEQTLYLDHPRGTADWELVEPANPHETTESYWRFRLMLPAKGAVKFAAIARRPVAQAFALVQATDAQFAYWVEHGYLDARAQRSVRKILEARQHVAELDARLVQLKEERDGIHAEQKRIRENLSALGDRASEKELRERLVRTLSQQEDRLDAITREEKKAISDREGARTSLNNLITQVEHDAEIPDSASIFRPPGS